MVTKYNPESLVDRTNLAVLLHKRLSEAKFSIADQFRGEDVYELAVSSKITIRVFSSIVNGMCRGNGEDAIRVVAIYRRADGKDQFLLNETRVNRTGAMTDIVNRTVERARDIYRELVRRKNAKMVCRSCGAPTFLSSKGNEVCAETCWVKK
jgi:hypothetical protein